MGRVAPEALNARCVLVVAAAGYGKTEWLRTWLQGRSVSWRAWEIPAPGRHYTGEFLEDDPYNDSAATTRELARAAYLRVLRGLAKLASDAGETDDAIHWLLRILELDRYDEQTHLDLVRELEDAGRHGEARRAHTRYLLAMTEIGAKPSQERSGGRSGHE